MTTSPLQQAADAPALPATPLRFILYFVAQYRWWYGAMVLLETLSASCIILIPYALGRIVKTVGASQQHSQELVQALQGPLWLFIGLCIGEVIFSRLVGGIQFRLGVRQRQNVTRTTYHYLQHHSHRYFSSNFAGALAHRISETSMGVTQTLWMLITEFWPILIILGLSVVLLAQANAGLGLFLGLWALIFLSMSWILARRGHRYAFAAATARSATTGNVVDSVTNVANTRLFARLDYEREHLEGYLGHEKAAMTRSISYSEKVRWVQFSAAAFLKAGLLWYALVLWGEGRIGAGEFVMAVSMSLLIINEVRNLSRRFLELFEAIGNVSNGVQTLIQSHDVRDHENAADLRINAGRISFDDVGFAYEKEKPVFHHLSLDIPAGQRVGLVGFSGSGKSTFVNSLLRLHDVNSGAIRIDGQDIRDFTQSSLHEQISLIPQDPGLFHRTLRENIGYGRLEASEPEIVEAAKAAHAHEFIVQMKEGYDSLVGERGVKLSGGQRQRIAIARVVLKDAPILILDEATSSLDSVTEKAIQETLDVVMKGKTVLVVAHRLSTIAHLDRILVFDKGAVIEDGSHAELLAKKGAYYRLWSRQSDGFLPETPEPIQSLAS